MAFGEVLGGHAFIPIPNSPVIHIYLFQSEDCQRRGRERSEIRRGEIEKEDEKAALTMLTMLPKTLADSEFLHLKSNIL